MKDVRIDKWLWATRIFKTRTIATEACKKGRVSVSGVNVKPSRPVKIGEVIDVKKPPITYSFRVKDVAENRMGAKLVPQYLENVTAPSQYELLEMVKISGFIDRQKGLGQQRKMEESCRDLQMICILTVIRILILTRISLRMNNFL